jgi:hypothetical protein
MPKKAARAPTPPHPITMANLARRAGVNRSSITKLARGRLRPAVLPGGRIDATHAEVRRWARERGTDPRSLLDPITRSTGQPDATPTARAEAAPVRTTALDELPEVAGLLDLTIREATTRFGSAQGARDWVALRRHAAEVSRIEARTQREAGLLISRELVRQHVFGALQALSFRLLRDMVENLASRLVPGLSREQRALIIRAEVTSQLTRTKQAVIQGLRASVVTGDHQPPPVDEKPPKDEPRDALRREIVADLEQLLPDTAEQITNAFPMLTDATARQRVVTAALRGLLHRAQVASVDRERQEQAEKELRRDEETETETEAE